MSSNARRLPGHWDGEEPKLVDAVKPRLVDRVRRRAALALARRGLPGVRHVVYTEVDARQVVVIAEGDTLQVYWADRVVVLGTSLSPRAALRIALFVLRWFVFGTWCGLRLLAYHWAQRTLLRTRSK